MNEKIQNERLIIMTNPAYQFNLPFVKTVTMRFSPKTKLESINSHIQQEFKLPKESFYVLYNGKILKEKSKTIQDLKLRANSKLIIFKKIKQKIT